MMVVASELSLYAHTSFLLPRPRISRHDDASNDEWSVAYDPPDDEANQDRCQQDSDKSAAPGTHTPESQTDERIIEKIYMQRNRTQPPMTNRMASWKKVFIVIPPLRIERLLR